MSSSSPASRYTAVAIALHWAMAFLLLFMIWLGWNMDDNEVRYQLHKSVGITLLFLTVARIAWRLLNPPPPLPDDMKPYERQLSHFVQIVFYAMMVIIPLAGWLLVSISPFQISTVLFGTVDWPHLPFTSGLRQGNELLHGIVENIHSKGAWVIIVLLGLHVAGAVKHEIGSEDGVLKRMVPGLFGKTSPPSPPARGALVAFGSSIILFAIIAAFPLIGSGGASAPAAPAGAESAQGNWAVDYAQSEIRFTGIYDGKEFSGVFTKWNADVAFYPEDLAASSVAVTVETASASTGTKLYDSTLREGEWFSTAAFPAATVALTDFQSTGPDAYSATATMTLKGKEVSAPLAFTLTMEGDVADLSGSAVFSRKALDLGQVSDAGGSWVSDEITVSVSGKATRIN
ncbi:cytochrome b/b6 domain-containing protein [Hyphomonas sp. WL0036]|uniref:cytochrome b/b6 domain-containing protein n=1 Tax=Hyphomonas sediminis TaxID=2866160 RepID=UPI001C8182E7|nr:cytochrome b/b6 domain-containing protein [Hyphomonas sediminis]MBY9067666.1 cytochrome b/b6 domain-containing protein [Hyphomonas sediminis]